MYPVTLCHLYLGSNLGLFIKFCSLKLIVTGSERIALLKRINSLILVRLFFKGIGLMCLSGTRSQVWIVELESAEVLLCFVFNWFVYLLILGPGSSCLILNICDLLCINNKKGRNTLHW